MSKEIAINTLILGLILITTFWIYYPDKNSQFVWDDRDYIQTNKMLTSELKQSIPHYFSKNYYVGNYHPVTMITYALINKFVGQNPCDYQLTILIIHLLNTLLCFYLVYLICNNHFISIWVSAAFAIHPMHVESIAWVSSLKDVLFSFFYLSALIFYLKSKSCASSFKYSLISFVLFLISALSKPAALSLPIVLLLLDWYKDQKFEIRQFTSKIHYFIISILIGFITIDAQSEVLANGIQYSFTERILLIGHSLFLYLKKLFIPIHLSALHLLPEKSDFNIAYLLSQILVVGLLIFSVYFRKKFKHLLFGILFFGITIFLMLQWKSFGFAIIAERYTYIAYIGLFFTIITFYYQWINKLKVRNYLMIISFLPFVLLAIESKKRVKIWNNEINLWENVISEYPKCSVAYYNLGVYYMMNANNDPAAYPSFLKAFHLNSTDYQSLINLGIIESRRNNILQATQFIEKAMIINHKEPVVYKNRAYIYSLAQRNEEAIKDLSFYLSKTPQDIQMFSFRASLYQKIQNYTAAIQDLDMVIKAFPNQSANYKLRAQLLFNSGRNSEAVSDVHKAISMGEKFDDEFLKQLGLQ
ncbi:MAG: hypothetical protein IT267_03065 [Saprospiraceae bacterium]|nr:hypothetical protein [Saprospiraceae bacterium]